MLRRVLQVAWLDADRIVLLWLFSAALAFVFTILHGGNAAIAFGLGLLVAGTAYLIASVETRRQVLFLAGVPLVAVGLLLQIS
jgi:hypothetical protein